MVDELQPHLTGSLEDYLESIYQLCGDRPFARVRDIASARGVKPGSVTPALKRLAELGMVEYVQREYVSLTARGKLQARRIFARHQLLTNFFENVLRMAPEAAEQQACALEHGLSDDGMDLLVRFFEFLRACPHSPPQFLELFHSCGAVREDVAGCGRDCALLAEVSTGSGRKLSDLRDGERASVAQVTAHGVARQRLLDMGLVPDVVLEVERSGSGDELLYVKLGAQHVTLTRADADSVRVLPLMVR